MSTPSGWYPDTQATGGERFWDGRAWTDQRRPASAALPPPGVSAPARSRWVTIGVAAAAGVIVFVGLLLFFDRSTTIDPTDLATSIEADLQGQDKPGFKLTCDDPGSVEKGDVTYCRGANEDGVEATIKVTFQSNGGYAWETM